ncbi:hypothetical protein TNCV_4514491 [Trichonephila clavipes]|nr:hypothetical protein TNCV_4514491 [Trichonephila clavipes]
MFFRSGPQDHLGWTPLPYRDEVWRSNWPMHSANISTFQKYVDQMSSMCLVLSSIKKIRANCNRENTNTGPQDLTPMPHSSHSASFKEMWRCASGMEAGTSKVNEAPDKVYFMKTIFVAQLPVRGVSGPVCVRFFNIIAYYIGYNIGIVQGFNLKNRKDISYPTIIRSAIRPVPHGPDLPIPSPPDTLDNILDDLDQISHISSDSDDGYDPGTNDPELFSPSDLNDLA